ncbi:MAG TPA: malectin [Terriglobales bacterium]|nr:malectin [Terriglobales bacterium]
MKKFLGVLISAAALGAFCLPAMAQTAIRVNCGGPAYTDSKGQAWEADTGYNGGSAFSASARISGTADPALFETGRQNRSTTSPLIYSFPVANGNYHVNLYFAETASRQDRVGARVFNVKLQGNVVFPNLDVFAAVGADAALVEGIDFVVTGGQATIEFDSVTNSARVNAIEILPVASTSPPLALDFVYPDGTPVSGTLSYDVSSSALSFRGTVPLVNGQAQATMLTSPAVLGLNVQFQVNLSLTDAAGNLLWQFSLGMNPSQINLGAVQSSALKVVVQKP